MAGLPAVECGDQLAHRRGTDRALALFDVGQERDAAVAIHRIGQVFELPALQGTVAFHGLPEFIQHALCNFRQLSTILCACRQIRFAAVNGE